MKRVLLLIMAVMLSLPALSQQDSDLPEDEESLFGYMVGDVKPDKKKVKVEIVNGFTVKWGTIIPSKRRVLRKLINNMVFVDGGTFQMGGADSVAFDDEQPVHSVTLSSYCINKYEVTQKEWGVVMDSNSSYFKGLNLPVEAITYDECNRFVQRLYELTGLNFRLPTEAEWEFAARGGNLSQGYKYSGSNNIDEVGWCGDNSEERSHKVGEKMPNELGLYDMSGNVYEWCGDWYKRDYYFESPVNNPQGPDSGTHHVLRGGSWFNYPWCCRVSFRDGAQPNATGNAGLRLAM